MKPPAFSAQISRRPTMLGTMGSKRQTGAIRRLQIKGRRLLPNCTPGQRLGSIEGRRIGTRPHGVDPREFQRHGNLRGRTRSCHRRAGGAQFKNVWPWRQQIQGSRQRASEAREQPPPKALSARRTVACVLVPDAELAENISNFRSFTADLSRIARPIPSAIQDKSIKFYFQRSAIDPRLRTSSLLGALSSLIRSTQRLAADSGS